MGNVLVDGEAPTRSVYRNVKYLTPRKWTLCNEK